ncbi:transglycosylase family protein [Kitasatospora sp. NPDC094015]|uniref:transglycosylase family protein n=1 Tax=Kitasatospora sp. NPDC094015 TaxID=3155205 RepID=UPI00332ADB6B
MLFTGTVCHRRWTRAEQAIVAGVAGAGLALPLLTAGVAAAAPVSTWEKVAQCESGGNWGINTGNGFYGGLQFTPSTWRSFGGTQYAGQAHQATKAQQITVAERVLAAQGPGAWPVCSLRAGLAKGGSPARVDADGPGRDEAPGRSGANGSNGGNSANGSRGPRDAEAQAAPEPAAAPSGEGSYTVSPGDTLSAIAEAQRVEGGWERLYQANRSVVGTDPDLIEPGQVLHLG